MAEVRITRILYMEDDPGLSRLLQRSLQRRGYSVDTAADGEEGTRMVHAGPYELLLVDYNMPYCGGLDVLRILSEKGAFPPVIMLTGEGSVEIAVEALKLGASDYLVKDAEMKYLELLPVVIDRVLFQRQLLNERQQMAEAVRESEDRYRRLVELSPDGIAIHSGGKFVFMNPAGAMLLGASGPVQLLGKRIIDFIHPDFREAAGIRMRQLEKPGSSLPWVGEKYLRLDGLEIDVEVAGAAFPFGGKPAVQVIFRDVSEAKQAKERLERMALYDTLTGLPNRTLFYDRMGQLLALAKRNQYILALLYMDLDHFKRVNDEFGHEVGDLLLIEAAQRMTFCTRKTDAVARMGGDEFIGICGKIEVAGNAVLIAQKVIAALTAPFYIKGNECRIGVSIGISLYPQDGDDVETLVTRADEAMYRAKETGRGGYCLYGEQ